MTNKELQEKLKQFPDDALVFFHDICYGKCFIADASSYGQIKDKEIELVSN